MSDYNILQLPLELELESKKVLKKCAAAHRALAELKGVSATIPNESILISTLSLQEAKDSSEVENIVTTHDDLYKQSLFASSIQNVAAKEVGNYAEALRDGFNLVQSSELLTQKHILTIQQTLEKNQAGYRKLPGTELKNQKTGEVVYRPPQDEQTILELMGNLEQYINNDDLSDVDPLVKMAVIHFQFESIHPFYDGNGRTGRIINILYLVLKDLLNLPVLYLSRYIIQNKNSYYRLLQDVRNNDNWEEWILFMLEAIEQTSRQTVALIHKIRFLMLETKHRLRADLEKIYSQDLLNNMFRHPYTKIEFLQRELDVTRQTATKYLDKLAANGFLKKEKIGRSNYYINEALLEILLSVSETQ